MQDNSILLLIFELDKYFELLEFKEKYSTVEERGKAEKYLSPKNNYQLLTFIIRRIVLSKYLKCDPLDIHYTYNKNGKPCLLGSELNFNVSHSQNRFLMGLTLNKSIGVDLELIKPIFKLDSFIDAYVSIEQKKRLLRSEGYDRLVLTYLDWCMKESFVKARGYGIKEEFKNLSYILENPDTDFENTNCERQFSWCIDKEYTNEATSNMNIFTFDEELAIAVSTIKQRNVFNENMFFNNTTHYKVNPNLKSSELFTFSSEAIKPDN